MSRTYRAMKIAAAGVLELVERAVPEPGPDEVLIEVHACGVCGADINDIERASVDADRVPGHEVVGRITAVGSQVPPIWRVDQRVGVGRLGGHCNHCDQCRRGQFQLCRNQQFVGSTVDGGYAEMMLAKATALVAIPGELDSEAAAPILCAGLATFNALKKSGAQAGDTVAILGIGGLGHMAIQYGRRMGFRVVAIGRGTDKAADAGTLGAHLYIDSIATDAAAELRTLGGATAVIATVGDAKAVAALIPGLSPQGRIVLLGAGSKALDIPMGAMVGGERAIAGSLTGSPFESEQALAFSVLADVLPRYESLPLEEANEAYRRMKAGEVRYRLVLTMKGGSHAHQ